MDLVGVRVAMTLWVFVSFMLVLYIAFHKRNRANYDEAANSVIDDVDLPENDQSSPKNGVEQ